MEPCLLPVSYGLYFHVLMAAAIDTSRRAPTGYDVVFRRGPHANAARFWHGGWHCATFLVSLPTLADLQQSYKVPIEINDES